MKSTYRTTLVLATALSLLLAAGCCSKKTKTASYSHQEGSHYAAATPEPTPPPTGRTEEGNMVFPLYQESVKVVGKREVDAGSVRLKKVVKTETVNQPVELRHEEVVIERESGAGQQSQNPALGQPFQESETVIHLKREEAVIEKQTVPAGQIVVQKRSAAEQTNLQEQIRREDIDIAKEGNPQNVTIGQSVQAAGAAESSGGQATGAGASGVITDPAMLTASPDVSTLAGRQVQLSGLKVRRTISDGLLEVSAGEGEPLYVVCNDPSSMPKKGDIVNVMGTVKPTSGSDIGLTGDAAKEISGKQFCIQAQKVEISNK